MSNVDSNINTLIANLNIEGLNKQDIKDLIEVFSSPLSWAEAFLHDPNTGNLFKANYVQRKILTAKGPWVVIRVPRRQGKSYSLSVLALWACLVHSNYKVLIIAPEEGQVSEFFEYVRNFLSVNPDIKAEVIENTKSPNKIKFSNNSTISGKTTGASSNRQGVGLRGKGADLIVLDEAAYLREGDFRTVMPMVTNDPTRSNVKIYAASTPSAARNRYYDWCCMPDLGWEQIHVPITEIPEITPERLAMIRSMHTDMEWIVEDLAEFPDIGDNVFKHKDIDRAKQNYRYSLNNIPENAHKVIGVDWDKHSCGVTIAVVIGIPGVNKLRLAYREEVPKSEYTLTNAVNRIIGLNEIVKPDYIYVDRGYGETQIELLKLYGKEHPESGLKDKVIGLQFGQNVDIRDPVTGEKVKKQFKAVMINTFTRLLEDGQFEFSEKDTRFDKQLRDYRVLGLSSDRIQTTRKNEHIIDAVGLAVYGLDTHFYSKLKFTPATTVVVKHSPIPVKSKKTIQIENRLFEGNAPIHVNRGFTREFSRGVLMNTVPTRKKF